MYELDDDDDDLSEITIHERPVRAIRDREYALGNCRSDRECRRGQVCRYVGRSLLKRCQPGGRAFGY